MTKKKEKLISHSTATTFVANADVYLIPKHISFLVFDLRGLTGPHAGWSIPLWWRVCALFALPYNIVKLFLAGHCEICHCPRWALKKKADSGPR